MRISDWSSDVCSSDLADLVLAGELDVGDGDAVAIANEGGDDLGIGEGGAVTVLHQGVFDFVHAAGDVVQQHQGEVDRGGRSEEHTSELQSLMRISYAVFCLKKKNTIIL